MAATGTLLPREMGYPWPTDGNFGDNLLEPWSSWRAEQRSGKCQGHLVKCYFEAWNCEVPGMAVAKRGARWWILFLNWHFHLAPNDHSISMLYFFLRPVRRLPQNSTPFVINRKLSGDYSAPRMFHSVWVCLPLNVQHAILYLLGGNRTHEPRRVAQVVQGSGEQFMQLFWVSGALATQSVRL